MTSSLRRPLTDDTLRAELGLTRQQWLSVQEAARDCHLGLRAYVRLMLLCAAGHGGVIEHAIRAVYTSWKAEKS